MAQADEDPQMNEIRQLEAAQDARAQALGYALIRMWPNIIEPVTRFVTETSAPAAAALFQNEKIWSLLGSIRHETGRHAKINAHHQEKIDALKAQVRSRCRS